MPSASQPSNRDGMPVNFKRRLRGSHLDGFGITHYVNALILHVEKNDQLVDHTDTWETECTEMWWAEHPPTMTAKKVNCMHCLADAV